MPNREFWCSTRSTRSPTPAAGRITSVASFSTGKGDWMSGIEVTRTRDRPPSDGATLVLPVNLRPLLGRWVNYDQTSSGIHHLEIDDWEGTPVVRAFGAG